MLSWIGNIISIVKALIGFVNWFRQYQDDTKRAEEEKRRQERDKAIDDSKKAVTDEDVWKSQDDIVSKLPKP